MRLIVRYMLLLLIAALSLQGVVAAAMPCHDGVQQTSTPSHQMAGDMVHHEAATEAHCGHDESHSLSNTHGKCSQCASCCIGASAPPVVDTAFAPAHLPTTVVATSEPAMTIYVPAALERPPRRTS